MTKLLTVPTWTFPKSIGQANYCQSNFVEQKRKSDLVVNWSLKTSLFEEIRREPAPGFAIYARHFGNVSITVPFKEYLLYLKDNYSMLPLA